MNSSLKETQQENNSTNNEINNLKEFYLYLKSAINQNAASKIDFCSIVENLLESSVQFKEKPAKSPRYDMALTIIEYILSNEIVLTKDTKLPECIASKLNQAYFDKLVKAFSLYPMNSLKTANFLIKSLRNVLHLNLSIVNPLLQVIECGFKHSNSDIKSFTYECWKCLILNFALDRDFFFKTKKFNLIITPLLSICKAYKDEVVSRSKALTWLCLIEKINERMPVYLERVLIPFLEFCFGLSDKKQESSFDSLVQIGFEVFVSIIFNGNLNQLNTDLKQKFKHVDLNRYYKIKQSMNDKESWLNMFKYYFQVFPKKNFLDCNLMNETWKKMCQLLKLNDLEEDDAKNWNNITKDFTNEYLTELECHYQYDLSSLVEFFLLSTFELISNSTNKDNTKLVTELAKSLCKLIGSKPLVGNLLNNEKFSKEFSAAFKKSINLLLVNEDEDESNYLTNLNNLLRILEFQTSLQNWNLIAVKYNDHLKILKNKTSFLNLNDERNETINKCLIYPFKLFENLEINETDLKQVISSEINLVKLLTNLIKSNRFKLNNDLVQINDWCSRLFGDLNKLALRNADQTGDCIVKNLQIHTQFILYLLQNAVEFETINQQQCLASETNTVTQAIEIIERINTSNKKFEIVYSFFTNLVDLIKKLIRNFHLLLTTEQSKMNSNVESEKNKQLLQIYCSLIELMSTLFTRVKSHQISNRFLIDFATGIEMLSDLNALSKLAAQTNQSEASPSANKRNSRLSQQTKLSNQIVVNFQANRHSNDLYDKFSMQIASFIQNHLNKSYLNHQFDSHLLEQLEPIFYSFLKNSKLSLKQKTIQAWNTTFGKSTAETLVYPSRLEHLFSDLKDEMCKGASASGSTPLISLPFFRSIQTNHLTNSFNSEMFDFDVEKENKPKFTHPHTPSSETMAKNTKMNLIKELINESSSSSVPVAMLLGSNKTPDRTSLATFELNKTECEILAKNRKNHVVSVTPTTNFVFSPAGQNSFANNLVASCPAGLSSSKQNNSSNNSSLMRTPEASGVISRSSPRSLKHNSKRKLDLNALIDQMPDQDFVEINMSKGGCETKLESKKEKKGVRQPLTEHQKEMRRKKSFIPSEMQSVSSVLEYTADSQMSCATTQDAYEFSNATQPNTTTTNTATESSFKTIIEFSLNKKTINNKTEDEKMNESNNQMDISTGAKESDLEQIDLNTNKTIKFQSKIKPNKQIELFEIKQQQQPSQIVQQESEQEQETPQTQTQVKESIVKEEVQESIEKINVEIPTQIEPSQVVTHEVDDIKSEEITNSIHIQSMEVDMCATPTSRRRSARLIAKVDTTPKVETPKKATQPIVVSKLSENMKINTQEPVTSTNTTNTTNTTLNASSVCQEVENFTSKIVVSLQKVNTDELLNKLNEELKNEKIESATTTTNNKSKNKSKQEKQNVMKINHKLAAGKIMKTKHVTNDQQKEMLRKLKYKNLIKKLKYGDSKNKSDEEQKETEQVEEVKSTQVEILVEVAAVEETKPIETETKVEIKTSDSGQADTTVENDDEDLPLAELVKTKKTHVETKEPEIIKEEKPSQEIPSTIVKPTNEASTPVVESKKMENFDQIAAETSESTAALIQKLNSTPTTSILKKKSIQSKLNNSVSRCLNLSIACAETNGTSNEANLTPNKRRVSFCDSVRVEEIEPNANKSMFRTTPKMPNRARLVLFNNNNNNMSRQVSSPLASSTNSILNSLNNIPTSGSGSSTSSTAASSQVNSISDSKANNSVNSSPSVQSKYLSNSLNSIANQIKANSTRLASCEPSGGSSENFPVQTSSANTPMSPSTSLINFFSNNKQSFLSPRSTMIQQQMLHLNSQKTDSPSAPAK